MHWPVYVFFNNLYEYEDPEWQIEALVVIAMMGVSAAMYHFVEDKMRAGKKTSHKVIGACLVLVTLIVSHHCMSTAGWSERFSTGGKGLQEETPAEIQTLGQALGPLSSTFSRRLLTKQRLL